MVEIEIGVLHGQFDRRINDPKHLIKEVAAWSDGETSLKHVSNGGSQPKKRASKKAALTP